MRILGLVAILGACGGPAPRATGPDALVTVDTEPADAALPDRPATDVLVGATRIYWTHGQSACSLEFGCPFGPTLTRFDRTTELVETLDEDDDLGSLGLAGTEDAVFHTSVAGPDQPRVIRRNGLAFSSPHDWVSNPVVAGAHIYWIEYPGTVQRATTTGDGSDATTIATGAHLPMRLVAAAGYLWWAVAGKLARVPLEGGAIELLDYRIDRDSAIGAGSDRVFIGRASGLGDYEIGSVDAAGSFQLIAAAVTVEGPAPVYFATDGGDVYWTAADGIYRAPIDGGALATRVHAGATTIFAVLADELLVDFTRSGFRRIPR